MLQRLQRFPTARHHPKQSKRQIENNHEWSALSADHSIIDIEDAAMDEQYAAIYQSGQEVLLDGWYEAVGVKAPIVSQFTSGQLFPNYDGRAICWHLHHQATSFLTEPTERPNESISDYELISGGMYA